MDNVDLVLELKRLEGQEKSCYFEHFSNDDA